MIVVDTNVFSELMRTHPDPHVVNWYTRPDVNPRLTISAVTVAELLGGIETMDEGRRRRDLGARTSAAISTHYRDRVFAFDVTAASAYAAIRGRRRRAGRPISGFDAQIAAICLVNDATLATRNVRDFVGCGIRVVNPWEPGSPIA